MVFVEAYESSGGGALFALPIVSSSSHPAFATSVSGLHCIGMYVSSFIGSTTLATFHILCLENQSQMFVGPGAHNVGCVNVKPVAIIAHNDVLFPTTSPSPAVLPFYVLPYLVSSLSHYQTIRFAIVFASGAIYDWICHH